MGRLRRLDGSARGGQRGLQPPLSPAPPSFAGHVPSASLFSASVRQPGQYSPAGSRERGEGNPGRGGVSRLNLGVALARHDLRQREDGEASIYAVAGKGIIEN